MPRHPEVVDILAKLVEFPTVNPPGKNYAEISEYLSKLLEEYGFKVEMIEIPTDYLDRYYPYTPLHRGHPRYVVLARYGSGEPILQFNGHYDVVPPGSGWEQDPFKATIVGDRVYGRGTTDMKGGIATAITATKEMIEFGWKPRGTIELVFVPDEESGGVGTRYIVENRIVKPNYVIISEPSTTSRIVVGHKGLVRGIIRVKGRQVHASIPWRGINAFIKASELVLEFTKLYEPILKQRKTEAPVSEEEYAYPTIVLGGYAESTSKKDNIVPGEFLLSFDRRVLPEEDINQVIDEIKQYIERAAEKTSTSYEVEVRSAVPASLTPPNSPLVKTAQKCVELVTKTPPTLEISPGRNDAVFYVKELGLPVINLGPGVAETAHMVHEYTTIDELDKMVEIYKCIIKSILS